MNKDTIISALNDIETPEIRTRKAIVEAISQGLLGTAEEDQIFIQSLREVVSSSEFQGLVETGQVTFAMIKPNLEDAVVSDRKDGKQDHELADEIIAEVGLPLTVLTSFSFIFTPDLVSKFYAGKPRESQENITANDTAKYSNRWEEFVDLMCQGPTTALILHDVNGHAISEWRRQMGVTWNVIEAKTKYPESIRAQWAKSNHNNIVHGSDAPESVLRELNLVLDSQIREI